MSEHASYILGSRKKHATRFSLYLVTGLLCRIFCISENFLTRDVPPFFLSPFCFCLETVNTSYSYLKLDVITPGHSNGACMLTFKRVYSSFPFGLHLVKDKAWLSLCSVTCANAAEVKLSLPSFGGSSILSCHLA